MTDRDDRIREIAYFLWLEEGCPEGQAERHWSAAESLLASDELERKKTEGEPPGDPARDSAADRSSDSDRRADRRPVASPGGTARSFA